MVSTSSQTTIEAVYDLMDLQPGTSLATSEQPPQEKYQSLLFKTAQEKLGVDSVFFYQPPNGGTSIPYIFFHKLESQNKAQQSQNLAHLHKLSWNLGRAPLLFVALPDGNVRIFDAYFPPTEPRPNRDYQTGLISSLNAFTEAEKFRKEYHRREFESGRYWQRNNRRFQIKKRADYTLLQNLKVMRRSLIKLIPDLSTSKASEIVHDLLGRSIFIKYLEDRRDSTNQNVFPEKFFNDFVENAKNFSDVLQDEQATYELFKYLNRKFNGDLFPVSDTEREHITKKHLEELRLFLTGQTRLADKQLGLWKFYSFDVIPIEFISSIYEEFFHISEKEKADGKPAKTGTYYTPHYLVELMIDEVLPWNGTITDFKTLDPACGSGIFLVEVYRRLIARWEQANPGKRLDFLQLIQLLTDNIFGVDLDKGAVRVAAFSLYLTLCDFLEPRQIWNDVSFPPLRQKNLFSVDFFQTEQDFTKNKYDLVIGNPPWQSKLTDMAQKYCEEQQKTFPKRQFAPDNQIALTFLWRAAESCKPSGEICLLMPSKGLLFNRSGTHQDFRQDFFTSYHVKTVINLSAYRHILFDKAAGAGTVIVYAPSEPDEAIPVLYCSPKPAHSVEDRWQITIEPQDIAELPRDEASSSDIIWKTAMWGTPRDYELIKKLTSSQYQTLEDICESRQPSWIHGEGVIIGREENQTRDASHLVGKPFFDIGNQDLSRFVVDEDKLPIFKKARIQWPRPKVKDIFLGPHILVKQSPKAGEKSFRAALLKGDAVFRDSFIGIYDPKRNLDLLAYYCLVLNSRIPLYYAIMTSRRWLVERDELNKEEVMSFPVPMVSPNFTVTFNELQQLANDLNWEETIQQKIEKLYKLTEDELILINDTIDYTLDYFRLKQRSHATDPTPDEVEGEKHLTQYIELLQTTLQNSFGTVFQPLIYQGDDIPLRVVGLEWINEPNVQSDNIIFEQSKEALNEALTQVNNYLTDQRSPGVFIRRHARAYIGNMIYIIKPDQKRYWTRSNALRDADEIYADIMVSREQ